VGGGGLGAFSHRLARAFKHRGPTFRLQRVPREVVKTEVRASKAGASLEAYVAEVEDLVRLAFARPELPPPTVRSISRVLGPEPADVLRTRVELVERRRGGIFLTPSTLANRLSRGLSPNGDEVLDPACGAGDLLISYAKRLPVCSSLAETLTNWSAVLQGIDLDPLLIRLAKARLALLCRVRSGHADANAADATWFQGVAVGDGMARLRRGSLPSLVLMNPPYRQSAAPGHYPHGTGLVTQAAVFAHNWWDAASAGDRVVALLPDVLRSGARYQKWRIALREATSSLATEVVGQFDRWTDVDVFLLRAVALGTTAEHGRSAPTASPCDIVGNRYNISVGDVVPHRDKQIGPMRRYLHAKLLPLGGEFFGPAERRRSSGRIVRPPFVVVRRTSRPSSTHPRSPGVVIHGTRPIAVENHLIVIEPKRRSLRACRELLRVLNQPATTSWLNERIRCRHLTVDSLREIPWPKQ